MKLFEGKTPAERNKLIAAIALGVISLFALTYVFFGDSIFGSGPTKSTQAGPKPSPSPTRSNPGSTQTASNLNEPDISTVLTPISYIQPQPPEPAVGRNVFAFYVAPIPTPKPDMPTKVEPPPPIFLSGVTPANVYARTGDFALQVSGDKFTPDSRIYFDNTPLATRFISAQQLSATVPAGMIANDGQRMIVVRATDPKMFSNNGSLTVAAPPKPQYDFVALIGDRHYQNDVAMLKSKGGSKDLISVQRGDVVSGRFRVTSISESEVAFVDTSLNIKHTLPFSSDKGGGSANSGGNQGMPSSPNDIRQMPRGRFPDQGTLNPSTSIPGIPDNIPRYTPPAPEIKEDVDDDDDGKP